LAETVPWLCACVGHFCLAIEETEMVCHLDFLSIPELG
jgi:hypothetical protein